MLLQTRPIQTINKIISVKGKVFYSDSRRRIDLKKPIRDLFETSTAEALYIMEVCLSKQKLFQRVDELENKNVLPVLLYFMKR
ncbi:hypothetical protein K9M79_01565 [Candidatus Woesearchaeota archaeon]|nr:hypothetical protein [Candidatus Woesearchaeota archaeon]